MELDWTSSLGGWTLVGSRSSRGSIGQLRVPIPHHQKSEPFSSAYHTPTASPNNRSSSLYSSHSGIRHHHGTSTTPTMAFPPMTHPCAPYPTPMHSARLSTRWSRHSQLSNEDWREGGMGTPLVRDLPLPPDELTTDFGLGAAPAPAPRKSFRQSIRNSWRSSILGGGSGSRNHRWSILNATSSSPPSSIPLTTMGGETAARPTPVLRKRKRWSNAIGSSTTTFVGNVRSSWGASLHTPSTAYSEAQMAQEPEGNGGRQKGRKRQRFLYGMAMSFGGLGAAGRVVA